ncbi:MAG: tRNA lysidine(34) synthetase TilS [Nitrospira sp.]|nr:tRNA lysidine(34) synthetase TilS [Nitrospira sp.]
MNVILTGFHHPLHKQVAKAIRARGLLQPGQKVLVAVSGGPDSVAMLSILHALGPSWNLSLTVVHCNYGLRGAESDGDARFVSSLCRRSAIPCLITPLAVTRRESGSSSSLQARAREARYRLFRELAGELGAERVALGHNADDQAETVLLRLLRGAGLRGLAGMPHIREHLFVRPLLTISRQDILAYLGVVGLPYRTDSSNAKPIYLRNRVRHELLPVLESLAPGAIRMLARQADIVRDDDRLLDALAAHRLTGSIQTRDATTLILDRSALLDQPAALQRRMLRQALQMLTPFSTGPGSDVLLTLLGSLASPRSGGTWKVGAVRIACEQNQLRMTILSSTDAAAGAARGSEYRFLGPFSDVLTIPSVPSATSWRLTGEVIRIRTVTRERGLVLLKKKSPLVALFDAEQLMVPLKIRTWRRGDWFCPAGMKGRRKKLQDWFTDAKLGQSMRERMPLMLSGDGIAWIVGQRIDFRFAATTSTTRFIVARVGQSARGKGAV